MRVDPVAFATQLVADAHAAGRRALHESEGFDLLAALGIRVPKRLFVRNAEAVDASMLDALPGSRVVVKVVAPDIAHKTDVGGVAIVAREAAPVREAIASMERALLSHDIFGYSIAEFIAYDASFGGEWLLGLRWTDEFGPVVTVGTGGVGAEFLASVLQTGRDMAVFLPGRTSREQLEAGLRRLAVTSLAVGSVRRQPARTTMGAICDVVERLAALAPACSPTGLSEFEVNPLVLTSSGLVALDVLAMRGDRPVAVAAPRPIRKIQRLMLPRSIAIMGVSSRANAGRVILQNLRREGFPGQSIFVIKPGVDEIDGCRAVPGIRLLPAPVDLLILAIAAHQVPEALIEATESRMAESVIVIPGGLEEKAGTGLLVQQMHDAIARARRTAWEGPVVNGGNCLGIQSRPGHCDTMFIPAHKLYADAGRSMPESGLAIVSQSGAFAVSRTTRFAGLRPRYAITVGNQMDLTIGDYLAWLEGDPAVKVIAVYAEGFKPQDGRAALDAVERITSGGRTVILYRAGRTTDGARATASHTAAVAGDYAVTRDLFRAAGAIVADTLDDFTELVMLFTLLQDRPVSGRRIGALSNAGYECVSIADNLGTLEMPQFTRDTVAHLETLLERHRIGAIVDVHNPLDVTPMMNDEGFAAAARAVLDDERVDVGVVACVPATPAVTTLREGPGHDEDLMRPDALAGRLIELAATSRTPFVAVVDAGALYDPLAQRLLEGGLPTFRASDRALRLLNVFVEARYADTRRAEAERWVDEFSVPV